MAGNLALLLEPTGDGELRAHYQNTGDAPLALTFWWNRALRVVRADGVVIAPQRGPELPCGVGELREMIEPGAAYTRTEPLLCTQPAGRPERIGWAYDLAPGEYSITLIYDGTPAHGFTQARPDPRAFTGRVESNAVTLVIAPRPPARGILARLRGLVG